MRDDIELEGDVMPDSATPKPDISTALADLMAQAVAIPGRTKRSAARLAIVQAIRNGTLSPGQTLPPEKKLTSILGVSLGTVQAALRQLQQSSTIIRRRGDGSRVASTEPLGRDIWHFRFVAKSDGQPLRILEGKAWIDQIDRHGDWSDFLGQKASYVRIRRRLVMHDGTVAGAEMFLDAAIVPGLAVLEPSELDMVNIRLYLDERFGIAIVDTETVVQVRRLDRRTAVIFGLEPRAEFFEIHAKAYSTNNQPVYFQRILVAATACNLTF